MNPPGQQISAVERRGYLDVLASAHRGMLAPEGVDNSLEKALAVLAQESIALGEAATRFHERLNALEGKQ